MKHIKPFEQFVNVTSLNEIGDGGAKPYNYKFNGDFEGVSRIYSFNSNYYPYIVEIKYKDDLLKKYKNSILVRFYIDSDTVPGGLNDIVTNRGELFRVMSTVVDIVKKDLKNNPNIDTIAFMPVKRPGEVNNARLNLYITYIKHNFKNSDITIKDNMVIIKKHKNETH